MDNFMTIPRLAAITAYQEENPPVHWLVNAYIKAMGRSADGGSDEGRVTTFSNGGAPQQEQAGGSLFDFFKPVPATGAPTP